MGLVLLFLTLGLEAAGIAWSYWFGSVYLGPTWVQAFHLLLPHLHVTTQAFGLTLLSSNLLLHLLAIVVSFRRLFAERVGYAAPGTSEIQKVERIYQQLASASGSSLLKRWPRSFRYNPGRGFQMRFVGRRLVIDGALFKSTALKPLLAHQLAYYNSGDLWLRIVLGGLPPPPLALGIVVGLGIGIGPFVTFLLWPWYWRSRIFAADLFAAQLSQKAALIDALDRLVQPREKRQNVFMREVPYVVERIDRLMRYRDF